MVDLLDAGMDDEEVLQHWSVAQGHGPASCTEILMKNKVKFLEQISNSNIKLIIKKLVKKHITEPT